MSGKLRRRVKAGDEKTSTKDACFRIVGHYRPAASLKVAPAVAILAILGSFFTIP
jgi:hypothetical protein